MDKIIALAIGAAVIVGGGSFYGGMKFQQSRGSIYFTGGFQNLRNLSPEERQDRIQQMGGSDCRIARSVWRKKCRRSSKRRNYFQR